MFLLKIILVVFFFLINCRAIDTKNIISKAAEYYLAKLKCESNFVRGCLKIWAEYQLIN